MDHLRSEWQICCISSPGTSGSRTIVTASRPKLSPRLLFRGGSPHASSTSPCNVVGRAAACLVSGRVRTPLLPSASTTEPEALGDLSLVTVDNSPPNFTLLSSVHLPNPRPFRRPLPLLTAFLHILSGASIPSSCRFLASTRAVSSHRSSRESRSFSEPAFSTGHDS